MFLRRGTQAVKALREEGIKVILVNSNPATIMTDPEIADRTYDELREYLKLATEASEDHPVLIDEFLEDAIEVDVDVLAGDAPSPS